MDSGDSASHLRRHRSLSAQRTLIIGYGNELRSDDAVGPLVAREVAGWRQAGVNTVAVHQLTPELAEVVATAEQVIFVDASVRDEQERVQAVPLTATSAVDDGSHLSSPQTLLAITKTLYGQVPDTWLITVPVEDLHFGQVLSAKAKRGYEEAVGLIRALVLTEGETVAQCANDDSLSNANPGATFSARVSARQAYTHRRSVQK